MTAPRPTPYRPEEPACLPLPGGNRRPPLPAAPPSSFADLGAVVEECRQAVIRNVGRVEARLVQLDRVAQQEEALLASLQAANDTVQVLLQQNADLHAQLAALRGQCAVLMRDHVHRQALRYRLADGLHKVIAGVPLLLPALRTLRRPLNQIRNRRDPTTRATP
jgi:hypothetical protein